MDRRLDYEDVAAEYPTVRRADPRIAAAIAEALGTARTVINVGAGTGSYEPAGRDVIAVEPSQAMIDQRPPGSAPAVHGFAESLPFGDQAFDAAMAILTVHHWPDQEAGLRELRRVSRRQVILTFDPAFDVFWLVNDYLPEFAELNDRTGSPIPWIVELLGGADVRPVEIPHDCVDGFLGAYWRRPDAYLDPRVRAGISAFAMVPPQAVERGIGRLRADLESGRFWKRHAELLDCQSLDLGYRLIVAG